MAVALLTRLLAIGALATGAMAQGAIAIAAAATAASEESWTVSPTSGAQPRLQPHAETVATVKAELRSVRDLPLAESVQRLSHLALEMYANAEFELGLAVDVERHARSYAAEAPTLAPGEIRAALDNASVSLLASGLDAHGLAISRTLLTKGGVSCGECQPPSVLHHRGQAHGVLASDTRRFVGCCLKSRALIEELEADVNVPNAYGFTPLHFAAAAEQPELAAALIARGANPSARTMLGHTPLHLAAARNATAVISAILATTTGAASVSVRDEASGTAGRTAADVACRLGFRYSARLIEEGRDCGSLGTPLRSGVIAPETEIQCGFDMRSQSDLGAAELVRDYIAIGKPVLIKGLLSGSEPHLGAWLAGVRWKRENLLKQHGRVKVSVGDIPNANGFGLAATTMSLAEYDQAVLQPAEKGSWGGGWGGEDGDGGVSRRAIVFEAMSVSDRSSLAHGFALPSGSVLAPELTALNPQRILFALGPRGAGTPMRYARAAVDILVRGSRTWLLQAPSEATYSYMHPADATSKTPWPWEKESLYSCVQEAGDIMFVPDMWARAIMYDEESLGFVVETETGANEFSIDL